MAFTVKDIAELKEKTGVGLSDCKKALVEADGDMEKAIEILRKKGMASAKKKEGRVAAEGIVDSYIHMGGKIGVLVEVNCETDFVARNDNFRAFVHDVALQIAASSPVYVAEEDVPADVLEHEKEILREQARNEGKPEKIIERMVEGRVKKFYEDFVLLDQAFVKDPSITIKDYLNNTIQSTGEKVTIRRFCRFAMGEGIEKKVDTTMDEIQSALDQVK
ncbi:MAG: translation elongation factor Ts [Clostridia bacterium]|nr:translation elongation factor Ts [Clostridia bacterium]